MDGLDAFQRELVVLLAHARRENPAATLEQHFRALRQGILLALCAAHVQHLRSVEKRRAEVAHDPQGIAVERLGRAMRLEVHAHDRVVTWAKA